MATPQKGSRQAAPRTELEPPGSQITQQINVGSYLGDFHFGEVQKRPFRKAASRDVGTVRVHCDSEALFRCKSDTGPRPGIKSVSSGSVSIVAALGHLTCQVSVANDGAREDCGASTA